MELPFGIFWYLFFHIPHSLIYNILSYFSCYRVRVLIGNLSYY